MLSLKGFLITFCISVAATLGWQSYGDAAREMIANSYPELGWMAPRPASSTQNASNVTAPAASVAAPPDQQQLNAMSLDSVRQSIDRIVANEEQITRGVDRLTVSQEQMTPEITKLHQYLLYTNAEPPPPQASAPVPKPVLRPAQAPSVLTPARNP